jgi:hypothetical protein
MPSQIPVSVQRRDRNRVELVFREAPKSGRIPISKARQINLAVKSRQSGKLDAWHVFQNFSSESSLRLWAEEEGLLVEPAAHRMQSEFTGNGGKGMNGRCSITNNLKTRAPTTSSSNSDHRS